MRPPWRTELRAITRLAGPIVIAQLGMIAMGTVDIAMVGHYSGSALAAVAIGHVLHWGLLVFGFGVLTALEPLVAQAVGAADAGAIRRRLQRGLLLAVAVALPTTAISLAAEPILRALRQPDEVVPDAAAYVRWAAPSILPFLVFTWARLGLQAFSITRPVVAAVLAANAVNALADWALIYGRLGLPELGVRGAALSTVICRVAMAAAVVWLGWPRLREHLRGWSRAAFRLAPLLHTARLGLPIGLQFLLEMGAFACTGLAMGWLGADQVAGHQIALNLASLSFMVPVGISGAVAVRVGYAVGRADRDGARRSAGSGLLLGAAVMAVFAAVFLLAPAALASCYTGDRTVLAVAAALVPLAGIFQVFDGVQVVAVGALRGLGDTKTALWVNLIGFWGIGLPVGMSLVFGLGHGPAGLWWGLVTGLGVVAITLSLRLRARLRGALAEPLQDRG